MEVNPNAQATPENFRKLVPLPAHLEARAAEELGEDKHQVPRKVEDLRQAVEREPGLVSRTDESFLLRFLRARKFDHGRALQLLKNYYWQKTKYPHLYKNLSTESISHVLDSNLMGMLNQKDQHGRYIFLYNSSERWDPESVSPEDGVRYCLLTLERAVLDPDFQVLGVVSIADCRGFGLRHLRHLTPSRLAQFFSVTQDSFPARFKQFHFVNEPPIFDVFYALAKPFIGKKLRSRLFFHGSSLSSLHRHFDPEILPEEFGGTGGPFSSQEWNKKLVENDVELRKSLQYGYRTDC